MALEDALVLARMLATRGPAEALIAFSERRHARVRWVRQRTQRRDHIRICPPRFATSRSVWQLRPLISEIIVHCSRSHNACA